jgi:TetR/AcrR family transcriptional repressor of mexJK operon
MAAVSAPTEKAESILAAARRMFLASGFGAVSMDAIAREAGASKATLYAYFASKEELFGAVVSHEGERYFHGFSVHELDPGEVEAWLGAMAPPFM